MDNADDDGDQQCEELEMMSDIKLCRVAEEGC